MSSKFRRDVVRTTNAHRLHTTIRPAYRRLHAIPYTASADHTTTIEDLLARLRYAIVIMPARTRFHMPLACAVIQPTIAALQAKELQDRWQP